MTVEEELMKAVAIYKIEGESRQVFLMRLIAAITQMDNTIWEKLSDSSKQWSNVALEVSDIYRRRSPYKLRKKHAHESQRPNSERQDHEPVSTSSSNKRASS